MGVIYRALIRPFLRFQDSERAHHRSLSMLRFASVTFLGRLGLRVLYSPKKRLPVEVFGRTYDHPFGLAAGMDKNAHALRGWSSIGLGFVEIGGITMLGQEGNPQPRMFRAPNSQALVNRMGFNNAGSEALQERLTSHFKKHGGYDKPLWVNLGKSKITPLEDAHVDYATTMRRLWPFAEVFVINVSSPNTPNLRELQDDEGLVRILNACHDVNADLSNQRGAPKKPLLVKVAPDLTDDQLIHVVSTAKSNGADGIVVCNTTVERPKDHHGRDSNVFAQTGGMSGQPLKSRSTKMIRQVRKTAGPDWPIIGVGGIGSSDDAWEKIRAGATLLQAYSAFVFEGPALSKMIVKGLDKRLRQHGFSSIQEAVGSEHLEEGN